MNNIFENNDNKKTDYIKRFVEKDAAVEQVYSPMSRFLMNTCIL